MQDGSLQLKVQEFWTCDERMISRGSVNKIATITSCQRSNKQNNNNNNNTVNAVAYIIIIIIII